MISVSNYLITRMEMSIFVERYFIHFNFEPSFKLRWCRARDVFGSQVPVTTGGFELRISCIQSQVPTTLYARDSQFKNPPVVTGINL